MMSDQESMTQQMMRFLERTRPGSSSSALAELRMAFPATNLCDRVRACRNWRNDPIPATERTADTSHAN